MSQKFRLIAVRAGSTYDPSDSTGLAHYFEHMVFKGLMKLELKLGRRRKLITQISDLYEAHKAASDLKSKRSDL